MVVVLIAFKEMPTPVFRMFSSVYVYFPSPILKFLRFSTVPVDVGGGLRSLIVVLPGGGIFHCFLAVVGMFTTFQLSDTN